MYVKLRLFVKCRHCKSSGWGGVVWLLCVRPISAMSWLKSPHNRNVWFGLEVMCVVMLVLISAICRMSSGCEGMYM